MNRLSFQPLKLERNKIALFEALTGNSKYIVMMMFGPLVV
jgi:hypothetical protein